jgi:hypothetical protein
MANKVTWLLASADNTRWVGRIGDKDVFVARFVGIDERGIARWSLEWGHGDRGHWQMRCSSLASCRRHAVYADIDEPVPSDAGA